MELVLCHENYFSDPLVNFFLLRSKDGNRSFLLLLHTCIVLCKKVFMLAVLGKHNGVVVIFKL